MTTTPTPPLEDEAVHDALERWVEGSLDLLESDVDPALASRRGEADQLRLRIWETVRDMEAAPRAVMVLEAGWAASALGRVLERLGLRQLDGDHWSDPLTGLAVTSSIDVPRGRAFVQADGFALAGPFIAALSVCSRGLSRGTWSSGPAAPSSPRRSPCSRGSWARPVASPRTRPSRRS